MSLDKLGGVHESWNPNLVDKGILNKVPYLTTTYFWFKTLALYSQFEGHELENSLFNS